MITLAAVLEYITAELLDVCTEIALKKNKTRISPKIIVEAIRSDHELSELVKDKWIAVLDDDLNPLIAHEFKKLHNHAITRKLGN